MARHAIQKGATITDAAPHQQAVVYADDHGPDPAEDPPSTEPTIPPVSADSGDRSGIADQPLSANPPLTHNLPTRTYRASLILVPSSALAVWKKEVLAYDYDNVVCHDPYDDLAFSLAGTVDCVHTLRENSQTTKVQLFLALRSDYAKLMLEALSDMRSKSCLRRLLYLFGSIAPRIWNTYFSGKLSISDQLETSASASEPLFSATSAIQTHPGYGIMREAAYYLRWIKKSLECLMTASFVELEDEPMPEELTANYLAFATYDDEELVRQVLNVGDTESLTFEKPVNNLITPGWKYSIKPPISNYENPVPQLRRRYGDACAITTPKTSDARSFGWG